MSSLYNYTIKYRTIDDLLEDINVDLMNPAMDKTIEPQQLIKVAIRVNYDLGLRIQESREKVLDIENGKAKLPNNFETLNFALLCGSYTVTSPVIQGTQVEEVLVNQGNCGDDPDCNAPYTCLNDCGGYVQLIQRFKSETRTYNTVFPLHLTSSKEVSCDCPNTKVSVQTNTGYIKDGFLYVNFDTGNIYINYQGTMEDEEGNLLVANHPILNEYYEYALKQRIIENRIMMGDTTSVPQLQLIEQRFRAARNNALSFVNTPNFAELKKIWKMNRAAMYDKYYNMFKSYKP
jgi:hypothetical protein